MGNGSAKGYYEEVRSIPQESRSESVMLMDAGQGLTRPIEKPGRQSWEGEIQEASGLTMN
jgi:hypothetical protein